MRDLIDLPSSDSKVGIASFHDEVDALEADFLRHSISVVMWPTGWKNNVSGLDPRWIRVKLGEHKSHIPEKPGVYAFQIFIECEKMPNSFSIIAYFGKAEKSLRERYYSYYRDLSRGASNRRQIHRLFDRWGQYIDFYYWVIEDKSIDILEVEQNLLDGALPPFSTEGYSAVVRAALHSIWRL